MQRPWKSHDILWTPATLLKLFYKNSNSKKTYFHKKKKNEKSVFFPAFIGKLASRKDLSLIYLQTDVILCVLICFSPMEIVGELQLAFVCFLTGQSLDAFEHWKKLIALMCGADAAIAPRRGIYIEFIRALETQLEHVPEDFLCDIVANNNFVYHSLRKLFANVEINPEVDGRLKSEANRMKHRLTLKFLWDFEDLQEELDDEAPVVVSLE